MLKCVVLCFILVAESYAYPTRIVNGTDAVLGEVPYIVSLQVWGGHLCGGSILDETHILTAAHCIKGNEHVKMHIQYGVINVWSDGNKINIIKKVYHEEYDANNGYANDVAVVTLEKPIPFSEYALPVVLPEQDEPIPAFKPSMLAGWGLTMTGGSMQNKLQTVHLRVYSDDECETSHPGEANRKYHVCSGVDEGGKGQCSGDSGGPLYSEGKQIGIVSWSVKPCAVVGYPGVYAKVSSYVNWIKRQMAN